MASKALKEINQSKPYFNLLSCKSLDKTLRKTLLEKAPIAFYSVITQLSRHILNKTISTSSSKFYKTFENSLYLLSVPSTTIEDKKKILTNESPNFIIGFLKIILKKVLHEK